MGSLLKHEQIMATQLVTQGFRHAPMHNPIETQQLSQAANIRSNLSLFIGWVTGTSTNSPSIFRCDRLASGRVWISTFLIQYTSYLYLAPPTNQPHPLDIQGHLRNDWTPKIYTNKKTPNLSRYDWMSTWNYHFSKQFWNGSHVAPVRGPINCWLLSTY